MPSELFKRGVFELLINNECAHCLSGVNNDGGTSGGGVSITSLAVLGLGDGLSTTRQDQSDQSQNDGDQGQNEAKADSVDTTVRVGEESDPEEDGKEEADESQSVPNSGQQRATTVAGSSATISANVSGSIAVVNISGSDEGEHVEGKTKNGKGISTL